MNYWLMNEIDLNMGLASSERVIEIKLKLDWNR
jgi:hypothetical protein